MAEDRDTKLGILASAILDGTPVDWPTAESTSDPTDTDVVRQLQIVAEIAALHRNLDPTRSSAPGATPALDETRPAIAWGHLQLLEAVGRGTFGEVYRAWDTHLDREVALKLLRTGAVPNDPSASLSDPARVVNEGRLLARVRHPNVITVYGAEPRDGRVGIWMEFIRGRTLHQIVEQHGAFGAREAATIGIDLCHALAAVHRAGLLHRDMTARNVMREDGGRVVLMDFGAGHDYRGDPAGRSGITGTPLYMAPELFTGGQADQRTDIYALGALLYYLVTRRFPVTGSSLPDIRDAHARGARARLRDVRPDLPAAFVKAIEQATAANPDERFLTAGDLEAALDAAMRGAPITTAQPAADRRPWLAIAAAAVVVIAASTWAYRANVLGGGGGSSAAATGSAVGLTVTARRITPPPGMWVNSNPSDDGRYAAGMELETGDAAMVDYTTGTYRALGIINADRTNGYASSTAISPDGSQIAVAWFLGDQGSLHIVGADGSGHRVLIENATDMVAYRFTNDATLILALIGEPDGTYTIALVAAADGAVRPLRKLGTELPQMMTLSPDARYVAYDYPQNGSLRDRDVFVLDAHTGSQWPVAAAPGQDTTPLWAPDGSAIVFLSDRNREFSAWQVTMANGRPQGEPTPLKEDVGRMWPRGFTKDGTLHYLLSVGFAEAFIGTTDVSAAAPQTLSPRQAVSNFYPAWSRDGRYIAYTSERRADGIREIWVHDTTTGLESRVPSERKLGRPWAWSPDGRQILVFGQFDNRLFTLDRETGETRLLSKAARQGRWLPEGIVSMQQRAVVLQDPSDGRQIRRIDFSDPGIAMFDLDKTGRLAMAVWKNGRITATDVLTGAVREWTEPGVTSVGFQAAAPKSSALAYTAMGRDADGQWTALKVQEGSGAPREVLRVRGERVIVWGWTGDGRHVLVTRWVETSPAAGTPVRPTTLWRFPVDGSAPVSTGLSMEGLRDISIHPDGRRITFNAGFKSNEYWVLENLLAQ